MSKLNAMRAELAKLQPKAAAAKVATPESTWLEAGAIGIGAAAAAVPNSFALIATSYKLERARALQ